jgi:hypothetical protein
MRVSFRAVALVLLLAQTPLRAQFPLSPAQPEPTAGKPPVSEAPPAVENLQSFDPATVLATWNNRHWQLTIGGWVLKDFGPHEVEARKALQMIQDLHLNQRGTVGTPPVMEYWLSDGQAPAHLAAGVRPMTFDAAHLTVEQMAGQWCLRDPQRVWFNFGNDSDEARRALAVCRQHHFSSVGALGMGGPTMLVFTGHVNNENELPTLASTGIGQFSNRDGHSIRVPHFPRAKSPPQIKERLGGTGKDAIDAASLQAVAPATASNLTPGGVTTAVYHGRTQQLGSAMPLPTGLPGDLSGLRPAGFFRETPIVTPSAPLESVVRIPFDWRQAEIRQDPSGWLLVSGATLLTNLGSDGGAARTALSAIRYYRFTEEYRLGGEKPYLTYFVASRQAPIGTMLGLSQMPLTPDKLEARQVDGRWTLSEGDRVFVRLRDNAEEARKMLAVIKDRKLDRLVPISNGEEAAVVLLVKSR